MDLTDLNRRFVYRRDDSRGHWRVLTNRRGQLIGDCEDYALTAAWMDSGRSIWRLHARLLACRYVVWSCRSPSGSPHAVMWAKGAGWIDNIQRRPVTWADLKRMGYDMRFPIWPPQLPMAVGALGRLF